MHANRFTNRFMNRFALFTSPHVNRVNGFRIDSRAHDVKIERLECMRMDWIHESIQVHNRTQPLKHAKPGTDCHQSSLGTSLTLTAGHGELDFFQPHSHAAHLGQRVVPHGNADTIGRLTRVLACVHAERHETGHAPCHRYLQYRYMYMSIFYILPNVWLYADTHTLETPSI